MTVKEHILELPLRLRKAALIVFIGVIIGLVEFAITTALATVVNGKFDFIQSIVDEGNYGQWVWVLIALPVITILGTVVLYLSPIAAGSSLPEIKGYLNGAHIPGIFGKVTTLVKACGGE